MERLQDAARSGRYHVSLALVYQFLGDLDPWAESAGRAVDEAERCGDERTQGQAWALLTLECVWSGRLLVGIERGQRAMALLERTRQPYWLAQVSFFMAAVYLRIGAFALAAEAVARADALGEAVGDAGVRGHASTTLAGVYLAWGKFDAAVDACRRALELAPNPFVRASAVGSLGIVYFEKGDPAQAMPLLEQAAEQMGQFRYPYSGLYTTTLGKCYWQIGKLDQARDLALRGLELSRQYRHGYGVALAQRTLGRCAQAQKDFEEARARFIEALDGFASV